MAIHPSKLASMQRYIDTVIADALATNSRATTADFNKRPSPGPVTDDEWVEFITTIGRKVKGKTLAIDIATNRIVRLR